MTRCLLLVLMTGRHPHAARRQLGIPARRFQPGAEHRSSHVPSGLLPFWSEQLPTAAAYAFFARSNLELLAFAQQFQIWK